MKSKYDRYSDEQLLSLLKNSDELAFTVLYHRYWDRIFYHAISKLKDHVMAEGLVQDVFTDIWKRREGLSVKGKLSTYLSVAVKYQVLNLQAKNRRAQIYEQQNQYLSTESTTNTEDWLAFEDLRKQLEKQISQLPEKGRLVFKLSREQGLSHKEIAHKLNLSEKAVERRIARAVQSLSVNLRHLL